MFLYLNIIPHLSSLQTRTHRERERKKKEISEENDKDGNCRYQRRENYEREPLSKMT